MVDMASKRTKLQQYLEKEPPIYKKLFEEHCDPVFLLDCQLSFIKGNESCLSLFGYSDKDLTGHGIDYVIYPADRKEVEKYFKEALARSYERKKVRIVQKNGCIKDLLVEASAIENKQGEVLGLFVFTKDMTLENDQKSLTKDQGKQFDTVLRNVSDMVSIIDETGHIIYRSPSTEKVLGYTLGELGKKPFDLVHPEDMAACKKVYKEIANKPGQAAKGEVRIRKKDGKWNEFQVTASNLFLEPAVNGIVVNYRDITDLKNAQREAEFMAYNDFLTKLPNRRFFEEALEQQLIAVGKEKSPLALMFIDVDRFKNINDTLGHHIGDQVLQEIAQILQRCVSSEDLVTRWAGDEFLILVSQPNIEAGINNIAAKIKKCLETPLVIDHYELFITVSIGVSLYPDSGENARDLMKHADLAMYLAKEQGKNRFQIFAPKMNISTYKTFSLQNDLNSVLKRNELELYYQPKVDAKTGAITGAEALIRWNHPEWGTISPAEFIPLAEDSGHIIPIGEWVLQEVCQQMNSWRKAGIKPVTISINLSVFQFLQKDFLKKVKDTLQAHKIEGKWLEIEVTESMILEKETDMVHAIAGLGELGIQVILDDFGTGYSSLGYLLKYQFQTIKLDKLFVQNIHLNKESAAIAKFVIRLAKQLNMKIVAEGIEFEEQVDLLRHLKCDEFQGYLFSKPKPAAEFELLLGNGNLRMTEETKNSMLFRHPACMIKLRDPVKASMTIVKLNSRVINIGYTNVLIAEAGKTGLLFISDIELSLEVEITLKFKIKLEQEKVEVLGKLVWHEEKQSSHEYGVEFCREEENLLPYFKRAASSCRKQHL